MSLHPGASSESSDKHSTAFDRALEDYIRNLPAGKNQLTFIYQCRDTGGAGASPEAINRLIQDEEARRRMSGPVKRLFGRIVNALQDYSDVIGQLTSAQPMPLGIVWGALKVVIMTAARRQNMFDCMKDELQSLVDQIHRVTEYQELYGNSESMQQIFFRSYTNMIRFWHRVHKECKRPRIGSVYHSLTSASSQKLTSIITDMKNDADRISKEANLCQAKLDRSEHEKAQNERDAANVERSLQSDWRKKQNAQNYFELCGRIRESLTSPSQIAYTNARRHESNLQQHWSGTCDWLTEDPKYLAWLDLDGASCPLLCLSGPPGYGKSILSSFAIQDAEKRAAVAYYFCQFSQQCDSLTDLLRLLALQLFNIYFSRKLPIDDDLCHQVLSGGSAKELQLLIRELVKNLAPTYFFIDGLDEAVGRSGDHVANVITFLNELCDAFQGKVRLWCSKRRQSRPVPCYETVVRSRSHVLLEISDHTAADVVCYLRAQFSALKMRFEADAEEQLSEEDGDFLRIAENDLVSRAEGNFLWARLMTQDFEGEERVNDISDLRRCLRGDLPKTLDDLYMSIFGRIKQDDRKIACKVISLIAFARRHLRIEEIRDATLLLTTRGKKNANDGGLTKMPWNTFLSKYTALIETDPPAPNSDSAGSCRLMHSSVLEFLINKPAVLGEERSVHITPYTIADACLLYLTRPIYSKLLQRRSLNDDEDTWTDASGCSMDKHHLAQYAAKYWAQHLDLAYVEVNPQLKKRVEGFLASTNFETCMQMQTLWVQGKFDIYSVQGRLSLLRTLPDWFIRPPFEKTPGKHYSPISKPWMDYCILLHNWRRVLCCGGCHDRIPDCSLIAHRGDVDRIWWAALGPHHSFSSFHSRYTSFRLMDGPEDVDLQKRERFEAIRITGHQFMTLRLSSRDRDSCTIEFVCEGWNPNDLSGTPKVSERQTIRVDKTSSNWSMYVTKSAKETIKTVVRPTMFSEDGSLLRIGSQLFSLDDSGIYQPLEFPCNANDNISAYFEEFAARGPFVALGSRAYTAAIKLQDRYQDVENFGEDVRRQERFARRKRFTSKMDDDSDVEDNDDFEDVSASSSEDEWGYESWSEASSDVAEALDSDVTSDEDASSDSETSSSDTDSSSDAETDSSDDSDEPVPAAAFLAFHEQESDDEDDFWSAEVGEHLNRVNQGGHGANSSWERETLENSAQIVLTVFDTSSDGSPKKIFQYIHPLTFMLYASPPVIHPDKPLLAWPLGAGDVFFVDLADKTYFIRKLRLSATKTRHISVKLHFSSCGRYLHIASLEAQIGDRQECSKSKCSKSKCSKSSSPSRSTEHALPGLRVYLLLATYHLSSRKTTRSPPTLVHRVKVFLGSYAALKVSQLPFTFSWTSNDLFVTENLSELKVLRIALFRDAPFHSGHLVLMPKDKIFLPDNTKEREVFFIPSADGMRAAVVLGSEMRANNTVALVDIPTQPGLQLAELVTEELGEVAGMRGMLSPPIGCMLQSEDLGGWVGSSEVPVSKGRGAGKFDRRREKFDPVDDCDVEPYLRFV